MVSRVVWQQDPEEILNDSQNDVRLNDSSRITFTAAKQMENTELVSQQQWVRQTPEDVSGRRSSSQMFRRQQQVKEFNISH